jgi:hypothetical protein
VRCLFEPDDRHARARDFGEELADALSSGLDTSASVPQATVLSTDTPQNIDTSKHDPTIRATIPVVQTPDASAGPHKAIKNRGNKILLLLRACLLHWF